MTSSKPLKNPFTVNCKSCNLPLADSFSLLDYKNKTLIFSSISTTPVIDKKRITEDDSVYLLVKCRCHMVVGRKYLSTSSSLNGYSGMYFLFKDDVYTYTLGLGVSDVTSFTSLSDVCEDVDKIQKLCLYLYKKIDDRK